MKAIILKELRENVKWGALMLLIMAIDFAGGLSTSDVQAHSLVGTAMLLITSIGFPAVGFALGLVHVLQDSGAGRWGFLTHRPISRSRIFFAKLIAGLCLYFLATLIPLATAVYWVATPGHLSAPFAWDMVLPRLADLLGGVMWYAAGMLVAARRARWIGSRLMPAGMALFGSIFAVAFSLNFGESILIFAIFLAILVPAAWGAFVSGGNFERQSLAAKLTTALCVAAGLICAMGALAGVSSQLLGSLAGNVTYQDWRYYQIGVDGRVQIVSQSSNKPITTTDLQGSRLSGDATNANPTSIYLSLQDPNPANMSWETRINGPAFQREMSYLGDLGYDGYERWYYVVQRRTIECFDVSHRQFIGSIGPSGYRPAGQKPQPFPEPLDCLPNATYGKIVVASPTTAYQIDLSHRTIVRLFVADPSDPIINAGDIQNHSADLDLPFAAVVTRSSAHIFFGGKEQFHVALSHPYPRANRLQLCLTQNRGAFSGYVLAYQTNRWDSGTWGWVAKFDAQGRLISDSELPVLPMHYSSIPWWVDSAATLLAPPVLLLSPRLWPAPGPNTDAVDHRASIALLGFTALAAISIWLTKLLLRHIDISQRAKGAWIVLNALLGLPGVALLFSLFQRIAAVSCPKCGKPRLVTHERCERCKAPFAPPAVEGIEVFE